MNTVGMEKVIAELRLTTQSLWDVRTRDGATVELSCFLEPLANSLQASLDLAEEARSFLANRLEP